MALIEKLNADAGVNGILVQLPLPEQINEEKIIQTISPDKDVDGFHMQNVGALCTGGKGYVSCTPLGIITLLKRSGIEIAGKRCVVMGRSNIVGNLWQCFCLEKRYSNHMPLQNTGYEGNYQTGRYSGGCNRQTKVRG